MRRPATSSFRKAAARLRAELLPAAGRQQHLRELRYFGEDDTGGDAPRPRNRGWCEHVTQERWQRLEAVLNGAMEREGAARASYLHEVCGDDDELRREAESLLSFHEDAEVVISGVIQGAAEQFEADDAPALTAGERLGVYRIVREIGRGGMGTVYLAERDDEEFKRQVAIKLVTQGMNTAELLSRFRRERQILARLDHPFIARLLDGGSTNEGRPFLVMEYVQGKPITTYCDDHRLGTRQRIELFVKVCSAVHSAHQKLVVHRDLKPGNILVDAEGSPKLLDFGIAKLLGPDDDVEVTAATGGMPMLTPQYASPEQVRSEAISTSADLYVLGVILYELVAGVRPYRVHSLAPSEILRAVCEEEPQRPSTASRKTAQGEFRPEPLLKADELDNIVLMAMQKEPERRYGSVAEFAADLQRYLDGLPVKARENTVAYRARKFIRRNRTGVTAAVLLVATLAAGVAVSALEARRAQKRFQEVRRIAHAVLYDIHDAIRDLPGSLKARELVVQTALQYLDGLAREAMGDLDLQLELAEAYKRVGDVQGGAYRSSLGHSAEAAVSYEKAKRIADELASRHPDSDRANLIRMAARESLGDLRASQGDIAGSLQLYGEGEEIGEAVAGRDPGDLSNLRALGYLYAASAREDQDNSRAIASARKSVAVFERLAAAQPNSEELQAALAEAHAELSSVLESGNHFEEAVAEERKDVRIHETLVAEHPLNAPYLHDLMDTYEKLGDAASGSTSAAIARPRDTSEALDSYRKAAALGDRLVAADPADRTALEERGMALMKLGMTISPEKDLNDALTSLRRAQADFQTLSEAQPGEARVLRRLAATHMYIGRRLASTGHAADAKPSLREAIRITDAVLSRNPKDLLALNYSWRSSQELAKVLAAQRQRSEALRFSGKAIEAAESARAVDGANPVTQSFLPQAYANAGEVHAILAAAPGAGAAQSREDWMQARDAYQKSVAAWEQIPAQRVGTNDWDAQLAHARAEAKHCAAAAGVPQK